MAKQTKYFQLFQLLKSAGPKGITPANLAKGLNFAEGSVPSYIWCMENYFGAQIQRDKQGGRKIVAYRLLNPDEVEKVITPGRRGAAAPKAKVSKVAVAKTKTTQVKTKSANAPVEIEDMEIEEITDSDLSDIKAQLGL